MVQARRTPSLIAITSTAPVFVIAIRKGDAASQTAEFLYAMTCLFGLKHSGLLLPDRCYLRTSSTYPKIKTLILNFAYGKI